MFLKNRFQKSVSSPRKKYPVLLMCIMKKWLVSPRRVGKAKEKPGTWFIWHYARFLCWSPTKTCAAGSALCLPLVPSQLTFRSSAIPACCNTACRGGWWSCPDTHQGNTYTSSCSKMQFRVQLLRNVLQRKVKKQQNCWGNIGRQNTIFSVCIEWKYWVYTVKAEHF